MVGRYPDATHILMSTIANTTIGAANSIPGYVPGHNRHVFSRYTPLNDSQSEIRILTLYASDESDAPLQCALEVLPLESAGDFIALSYCWGAPGLSINLGVNNEVDAIQTNLWTFLHRLRSLRGRSRVWVDYLCINQRDYREKGPQVKLMADVFQRATAVYAWLGESSPEIESSLANLHICQAKAQSPSLHQATPLQYWPLHPAKVRLIRALSGYMYWRRIWIVQEVLLAQSLWIMVGNSLIDGTALTEGVGHFQQEQTQKGPAGLFWAIISYLQLPPTFQTLNGLVSRFHQGDCHDPRDRIYGMLELFHPSDRSSAIVDYEVSVFQAIVNNFDLTVPDLGEGADPQLFAQTVGDLCCRSPSERILFHEDVKLFLRSPQPKQHFLFQGKIYCLARHTVAALRADDRKAVNLTVENLNQDYDIYIILVRKKLRYNSLTSYKARIIYSTTIPGDEDLIVELGPVMVIVRQCRECFWVTGFATAAQAEYDTSDRCIDPWQWLKSIVPSAGISIVSRPRISNDSNCQYGLSYSWKVQLNGAALAHMVYVAHLERGSHVAIEGHALLSSLLEDAVEDPIHGVSCYKPNHYALPTISTGTDMLPIYFQDPRLLPESMRKH